MTLPLHYTVIEEALAALKAQTPDPLEDLLKDIEGEERQALKQATFGERYGMARLSKKPSTRTTHKV